MAVTRNHYAFYKASDIGLSHEEARRLTDVTRFEISRANGTKDVDRCLNDPGSFPRQLISRPELCRSRDIYCASVNMLQKLDQMDVGREIRDLMIETFVSSVREKGCIPKEGLIDAVTSNGEHVKLEWTTPRGSAMADISATRSNRVA